MKRLLSSLRGIAATVASLAATIAVAQTVEEFPLRPPAAGNAPSAIEEVVFRMNSFDDHGLNRAVQKVAVPTLTVFRPIQASHRGAAIVLCPGGGYQYVTIDREGFAIARYFQQRGLTVAVLKYRLPQPDTTTGLPLPIEDGLEAVKFVRQHAADWGIDPHRVGIMGCSAGGHLAGSVALLGEAAAGSRPDFAALLYPVIFMEGRYVHQGSRRALLGASPPPERAAEFSLDRRVHAGLPPFFLVHAKDDRGVPPENSMLFAEELKKNGDAAELLLVAAGGHGFGLGRDPEPGRWKEAFLAWLDRLP
jgi:acetyl esterase/lipase